MADILTRRCSRKSCKGKLIRTGDGTTPGSSGTYRCDFCFNLSDEELKQKIAATKEK